MLEQVFATITKTNTLSKLDAALFYAQVAPVFPLRPNEVGPLLSGSWKQYATRDPDVIRQWWTQFPDANIAWVMGEPVMASDLDMKNAGEDGWSSYQDLSPGDVPYPIQGTPSGGYHLLHKFSPGLINFTHQGAHGGLDLRTTNGYIVVAPSIRPDGVYEWLQDGLCDFAPRAVVEAYTAWSQDDGVDRDLASPDPTPFDELPPLDDTTLRTKHLDFLQTGEVHESYGGDRSAALLGATIALYQLGLSDEDVLGYLEGMPGSLACAQDHASDRRASVWLWKYTCLKAREKRERLASVSVDSAFREVTVTPGTTPGNTLPDIPGESERERWVRLAENVNPNDDLAAVDIYRAAMQISPMFANQIADIIHQVAGFRKSDMEKAAKQVAKQQARSINQPDILPPRLSGCGLQQGHPVLQPPAQTVESWNHLVGRYVYIATENRWLDRYTRETLTPEALNTKEGHTMERLATDDNDNVRRATDSLAARPDTLKVDVRSYWPGVENDLIHIGRLDAVNTWQPSNLEPVEGDISVWWGLFCHLFPEETSRNNILDWMAHILQKPHIKINYALLIGGRTRIGKDSVFQPLIQGVGIKNVNNIKAEMLDEKYDDHFIGVKLAVLQEIHREGFRDAQAIENKLKVYLADPPYELVLRRLGATHVTQRNLIQILAFTNYKDAIHVGSEGERYLCEWTDAKKLHPSIYKALYDWYEKENGGAKVIHFLLNRDISHFEPKSDAPATRWRTEMISSGRSDLDYQVEDVLDRVRQQNELADKTGGHKVSYITPKQIADRLNTHHHVSLKVITHILADMGVERLRCPPDDRFRVPRIFVEDTFANTSVPGEAKFENTIRSHLYAVEPGPIPVGLTEREVLIATCPPYLLTEYMSSIN